MRSILIGLLASGLSAEPIQWADLPPAIWALLAQSGLSITGFPVWQARHKQSSEERLAAGSAEHIAYFLLQSTSFTNEPAINPALAARRYFDSLPPEEQNAFLAGKAVAAPVSAEARKRADAFSTGAPAGERHHLLREMATCLGWPSGQILQTAFRFLIERSEAGDANAVYETRGLSADPFPPSMRAVEKGLAWLARNFPANRRSVLLAGPGAELGSRFGVDDAKPVASPQPAALLKMLAAQPRRFDCVDIRPEVTAALQQGPCRGSTLDLVADRLPENSFNLVVATNVLVYLNETELALALANIADALRPGGCLLHNDPRFAARLFGEAAGMPVVHFEAVALGRRGGREQMDRVVVHCRPAIKM